MPKTTKKSIKKKTVKRGKQKLNKQNASRQNPADSKIAMLDNLGELRKKAFLLYVANKTSSSNKYMELVRSIDQSISILNSLIDEDNQKS